MFGTELQIFIVFCLVFLNAFFVAVEFAIIKMRSAHLEDLFHQGDPLARIAQKVIRNLDTSLFATQLGVTFASLGLGWIGEPAFARLLTPGLQTLGIRSETAVHSIAFTAAFAIIAALHMVLGKLLPKFIAIRKPRGVVLWTSLPFWLFYLGFYPAMWLLNAASNGLLRLFGVHAVGTQELAHSEEELRTILSESQRYNALTADKINLLESVLDYADLTVAEIIKPRQDVDFLSLQRSWQDNLSIIYRTGHTRYPLCEGDVDHPIGMIHIKDIFLHRDEVKSSTDLLRIKRQVLFVPQTRPVELLLRDFQQGRLHMAIVVDEYGITVGLVTMEDVLEELVGEIQDEFDAELPRLQKTPEGYVVDGLILVEEMADELGIEVEVNGVHTLGGYVHTQLGRIARVGDVVALDSYEVRVMEMGGQRVTKLLVMPQKSQPSAASAES
jgi:CBS domain containing-hemolysin-like protein